MSFSYATAMTESLNSICRMQPKLKVPPWSRTILLASLGAYGVIEAALILLHGHRPAAATVGALAAILLLLILTSVVLTLGGYAARLPQTLVALAASGSVVGGVDAAMRLLLLLALPSAFALNAADFLLLPILLWNFLIAAYVFRHALDGHRVFSFGLALAYIMLQVLSFQQVYRFVRL